MQLVATAVDGLPEWVRRTMDNVDVLVDDEPSEAERGEVLGLYHGIPLTDRDGGYAGVAPDTITLYQGPIERAAKASGESLAEVIARTLRHEVAHHFGIDDERLLEIDAY
jgi:predicted Zn-dependent protease with MMP-like domain